MTDTPPAIGAIARSKPLHILVLLIAIGFYAWRANENFIPAFYGIADEHGYLTTAKRLATTGHFVQHQEDPYAFVGETMMKKPNAANDYFLRQPMGYPLLLAAGYSAWGNDGPFFINPICGILVLVGIFMLGREFNLTLPAALVAIVLAAHPIFFYYTIKPLSHVPDMAVATWLMVAAFAWRRRHLWWQALLVGVAFGYAVMIRYTNVLLLLPLAVILFSARGEMPIRRLISHVGLAAIPALLAAGSLIAYHVVAYGHPFVTGYNAGGADRSFSFAWFVEHTPIMLRCIAQPGTGLTVLLLAVVAGIVILAMRQRLLLGFLLAWALPPIVLYTAYYGISTGNLLLYTRFALASYVPLLFIALAWPQLIPNRRKIFYGVVLTLAAVTITWNFLDKSMNEELDHMHNHRLYMWAAGDLFKKVPRGAVVLADNYTDYYADYLGVGQYTVYTPHLFSPGKIKERTDDLLHNPREFDPARTYQIRDLVGNKSLNELNDRLRENFCEYLAIGRRVYLLTSPEEAVKWQSRIRLPLELVAQHPLEKLNIALYEVRPE